MPSQARMKFVKARPNAGCQAALIGALVTAWDYLFVFLRGEQEFHWAYRFVSNVLSLVATFLACRTVLRLMPRPAAIWKRSAIALPVTTSFALAVIWTN